MRLRKIIFGVIIFLLIGTILLASDLYFMWIPFLSHSAEYPIKVSALFMAVSVLVTAVLAYIAALAIEENQKLRREGREREDNDRNERLLNEIIDWAKDVHNRLFGKVPFSPRMEKRMVEQGYKDLPIHELLALDDVERDTTSLDAINILTREGRFMELIAGEIADELVSLIHVAMEQMKPSCTAYFKNFRG